MKQKTFTKLSSGSVQIFKLKNRRGYAAICKNNLTEGASPVQAFQRMVKAVKREGFLLAGSIPKAR